MRKSIPVTKEQMQYLMALHGEVVAATKAYDVCMTSCLRGGGIISQPLSFRIDADKLTIEVELPDAE